MGLLRVDHPDILEFITCKDDLTRFTNFNISVGLTEEFMKAVINDEEYELINPRTGEIVKKLKAKEVFDFLSKEEGKHYGYLKKAYDAASNGEKINIEISLPSTTFDRIFSDDFLKNLKGKNFEFSAISTGMILEKNSVLFYSEQANKATDPNVKHLFEELAKWEEGHLNMLTKEYNDIKEKFWEDNRFAPF
jgi:rubrerythrin